MSILKRMKSILKSQRPEAPASPPELPFENTRTGDIISIDLEDYVVTGKVTYYDRGFPPHRYAYYLKNGTKLSCLIVEKSRIYECFLCEFLEGGLDDPTNVPTRLDIDGQLHFELEHHRSDRTRVEGHTDFRNEDEVMFWRYFGEKEQYFFLQWQDGKFVALQGERTPSSNVKFMRAAQ